MKVIADGIEFDSKITPIILVFEEHEKQLIRSSELMYLACLPKSYDAIKVEAMIRRAMDVSESIMYLQ